MVANVIYRGPIEREPETINLPVAAITFPGEFVLSDGEELTRASDGFGRLLLASTRRMYAQTDVDEYEAGETAIAYRVEVEHEYRVRAVLSTYSVGDELTVGANGRVLAAVSGDRVVAFSEVNATLGSEELLDIVIANSYIKA